MVFTMTTETTAKPLMVSITTTDSTMMAFTTTRSSNSRVSFAKKERENKLKCLGFYYDGFYYDQQDKFNKDNKDYWYKGEGKERMLEAINGIRTMVDHYVFQNQEIVPGKKVRSLPFLIINNPPRPVTLSTPSSPQKFADK